MRRALLFSALPLSKWQPPLQMPKADEKTPFTCFVPKLVTDLLLLPAPVSFFSFLSFFFCFLITNPLAMGGSAWVNRAVGACHVCSSGGRSSQRSGMRWFVVIGSYLETGLMELSKLYANSLFSYQCRCTPLRCTEHTRKHVHRISRRQASDGNAGV